MIQFAKKPTSERHEKTATGAAILCLTVCGCDVMNNASVRCTVMPTMSQANLLLIFIGKEWTNMAAP